MARTDELIAKLTSPSLSPAKVKAFAQHVAKVETATGIKSKNILINGIPPFDDIPTVEFDIPKDRLGSVIGQLLANQRVNPNIIINGIPALDHYRIQVMGKR